MNSASRVRVRLFKRSDSLHFQKSRSVRSSGLSKHLNGSEPVISPKSPNGAASGCMRAVLVSRVVVMVAS